MSLIEDARSMIGIGPGDHDRGWTGTDCHFCAGILDAGGDQWPATDHKPDCPWLAMPRIVAALEAADALIAATRRAAGGHYPTTMKRGPYKQPDDPDTIQICEAYCSVWPCDAERANEAADALADLLNPTEVAPSS